MSLTVTDKVNAIRPVCNASSGYYSFVFCSQFSGSLSSLGLNFFPCFALHDTPWIAVRKYNKKANEHSGTAHMYGDTEQKVV